MRTPRPHIVIGNPANRRVGAYSEALAEAGLPPAEVVSYSDLLTDPGGAGELAALAALDDGPAIVRQDSAGEDFDVEKALLIRGYEDARACGVSTIDPDAVAALAFDRGRILCPRQQHLGFESLLAELDALYAKRPAWRVLQPPRGIAFLFDKRETSARWSRLGIAVPPALPALENFDQLRAIARERDLREIFIKVSCSSSASCLAIYRRRPRGVAGQSRPRGAAGPRGAELEELVTTIECADTGWYNSLKLSRFRRPAQIAEVVNFLLAEGAQVEVRIEKAELGGHPFDLRFVVIDGEAAFGLVRQNRHAITNLHLGGWRGEWSELERAVAAEVLDAARADAVRAAATSGCFVAGVDVLIEADRGGHRVIEGNAFGDLLPGLERDGLSVYGWQIARLRAARD